MPVDPVVTRRFLESLSTHMEDHLATWKSNLVDARREIDTLLSTLSDKIPAQAKPLFPEDIVELMLEDALPPPPPPEKVIEKVIEKVMVPAGPSAPDWGITRSSIAAVEAARTQVDVLTRFLAQANAHASRVALIVLRNERLTGWKALGFDASGGRDDGIKALDLAADEDSFASAALKGERSLLAEPPDEASPLRRGLGGRAPSRTLLVPMVIRDRVAGLLCADELAGEEGRLNEAALEVLTFVTGLTVDLLAARKKIPSPSLTPGGEPIARFKPAVAAPPAPAPAPPPPTEQAATVRAIPAVTVEPPTPVPAPAPRPVPPPRATPEPSLSRPGTSARDLLEPSGARPAITDAREALRALEESAAGHKVPPQLRTVAQPPSRVSAPRIPEDLGLTTAIPSPTAKPQAPPPPPPPPAPVPPPGAGELTIAFEHLKTAPGIPAPAPPRSAPPPPAPMPPPAPAPPPAVEPPPKPAASAPTEALMGGSAAPMAPPPGFVPRSRLRGGDDSQRAVDDAKRLARLLVSEIKLYNERKVEEGKAAGDLYERLKDDIERSRQVYEERTPEPVRRGTAFFREELVRILADGRAEAFGPMP